jgi:NADP-dependent 3-hydroxy acid dehydrogenase YdfG
MLPYAETLRRGSKSMSPRSSRRLTSRTAVITGASSGIGRSIALAFAKEGAELALLGRNKSSLEDVAEKCKALGTRAVYYGVDLLNETEIQEVKHHLTQDFSGVDILVHSAGVIVLSSLATASLSDFDYQHRCNVLAPFLLTQLFLPALTASKGDIVFINSTAGLTGTAGTVQYSATKHALKGLSDSLREEVNARGVRVLSIYLGRTASPMQQKVCEAEGKVYTPEELIQPEQVASVVVGAVTLGPEAEITEIRMRPARKPLGVNPQCSAR